MVTVNRIQKAKRDKIIREFDACKDLDQMKSKAFDIAKRDKIAIQNVFRLMGYSETYNKLRLRVLNKKMAELKQKKSKYTANSKAAGLQKTIHDIELTKRAIDRVKERQRENV